jgi:beta-galactosidase
VPSRVDTSSYYVNSTVLKLGKENVLVVRVDCTEPDGWWYDGGGIYRNVWFTTIESPGWCFSLRAL